MPDEPTLGEVVRRLEAVHLDLKDDLHQLAKRLDGKVSSDVFELRMSALERDITAAAKQAAKVAEQQRERDRHRERDRRLLFTALIAPALLIILQVYLSTQGAGG